LLLLFSREFTHINAETLTQFTYTDDDVGNAASINIEKYHVTAPQHSSSQEFSTDHLVRNALEIPLL
jgi:hypothetical protein